MQLLTNALFLGLTQQEWLLVGFIVCAIVWIGSILWFFIADSNKFLPGFCVVAICMLGMWIFATLKQNTAPKANERHVSAAYIEHKK